MEEWSQDLWFMLRWSRRRSWPGGEEEEEEDSDEDMERAGLVRAGLEEKDEDKWRRRRRRKEELFMEVDARKLEGEGKSEGLF
jgi:hypothetical protein